MIVVNCAANVLMKGKFMERVNFDEMHVCPICKEISVCYCYICGGCIVWGKKCCSISNINDRTEENLLKHKEESK